MARDPSDNEDTVGEIADCDAKLAQYRAVLDAGASRPRPPRGSPRPKLSGQALRPTNTSREGTFPLQKNSWRLQARPNVLIEAGMALATHPSARYLLSSAVRSSRATLLDATTG